MRIKRIELLALIGLGSLGVLGSSTNLAENFFKSVKNNPAVDVFLSKYRNGPEKSNAISQAMSQNIRTSGLESTKSPDSPLTEIPEHVLYDRMFSLIVKFREMSEEQASRGEEVTPFHGYFEREANLNEWQAKILQETSLEYVNAVGIVDGQAEIIIEQLRLQYPVGSMPKGELIKPSPELLQLQKQRDKLALYYRDQVSILLGNEKFDELNKFVRGRYASSFQVLPVPSVGDGKDKGVHQ